VKGACPSGYNKDLPISTCGASDDDELSSGLVCALTIDTRTLVNTLFNCQC